MAAKCQIIRNCGTTRRICRNRKGRITSNTVISRRKRRKAKRKSSKRRTRRSSRKARRMRAMSRVKNVRCVRRRVSGKCRQICYSGNRIISNDAAKRCKKKPIWRSA